MTTQIEITQHNAGQPVHVGWLTIDLDQYAGVELDAVANEDGLPSLVEMASDSTIPDDYSWTGDEVYEITR